MPREQKIIFDSVLEFERNIKDFMECFVSVKKLRDYSVM